MVRTYKIVLFFAVIAVIILTFHSNSITDYKIIFADVYSGVKHSGNFCVIYDYWNADKEYAEGPHITLVLHATSNYIVYLEQQLSTWDGGISVAVYIPTPKKVLNNTVDVLDNQMHLKSVFSALSSPETLNFKTPGKVSLHLFYKWAGSECPTFVVPKQMYYIFPVSLSDTNDFENIEDVYPINAARNIARKGSRTKLFVSGDIEQFYVKNFEPRMYKLAKKVLLEEKKKTVLVYRRFEINATAPIPQNKKELKKLVDKKQAVEFHKYYYAIGHRIRNLTKWLNVTEDGNKVKVFDELFYRTENWEPQFVGDERIPFHDERFPYRHKSNVHLGLHLCFKNYTFSIVSDVFSVHQGIMKKDSVKVSFIRSLVRKMNVRNIDKAFRKELIGKYPKMKSVCPR